MIETWICPNCGKLLDVRSDDTLIVCHHCYENLTVSPDNKLVLATPIRTYLLPNDSADKSEHLGFGMPDGKRPNLSSERRKRAAQLAYDRLTEQEQLDRAGLVYGILAIIFGVSLSVWGWLRQSTQTDWIGWTGVSIGAIVLALGLFVEIWFLRSIRSMKENKRAIEKEMPNQAG